MYPFVLRRADDIACCACSQVIASGDRWYYHDSGVTTVVVSKFFAPSFSTSSWKQGAAPLGYGLPSLVKTTVAKAGIVTLFRKSFSLSASQVRGVQRLTNRHRFSAVLANYT